MYPVVWTGSVHPSFSVQWMCVRPDQRTARVVCDALTHVKCEPVLRLKATRASGGQGLRRPVYVRIRLNVEQTARSLVYVADRFQSTVQCAHPVTRRTRSAIMLISHAINPTRQCRTPPVALKYYLRRRHT